MERVFFFTIAAWLAGCAGEPAQEAAVAVPLGSSPAAWAEPEPAPSHDGYVYNPIGKRDPYRVFFPAVPGGGQVDCLPDTDPVQCFAVEQLRLTGVVWGERPRALLEDPDGGSHVVEIGTYVGNRWGRITLIESGSVVVTEEYLKGDATLVTHPIRLRLEPVG